jgi:hypothetical protein
MPEETTLSQSSSASRAPQAAQAALITQELVEKLAERVYELLVEDLKTESERYRLPAKKWAGFQGGR